MTRWLSSLDCARLELETRLDVRDWRLCATPAQLESVLSRLDLVVTDRLHGMVLALRAGVPALAVDPVEGGAKVTAQARACGWPALVPPSGSTRPCWISGGNWCATVGRGRAREIGAGFRRGAAVDGAEDLVQALRPGATG